MLEKTLESKITIWESNHWKGKYCSLHKGSKVYEVGIEKICGECGIMSEKAKARAVRRSKCEIVNENRRKIKKEKAIKAKAKKQAQADYKAKQYKD